MKIFRLVSRTATLLGLVAVSVGAAHAQSITPTFTSATGSAGNVTYVYDLFITADTRTVANDVFTFYDFNGLLGATPAGGGTYTLSGVNAPTFTPDPVVSGIAYSITAQNTGINPLNTNAIGGDDPTQPNISLTETGIGFSNTTADSVHLGTLVIHSTNVENVGGDFTSFAANTTKISSGSAAGNQGSVSGPNSGFFLATPEPGTWAMMFGMGVSGLAFARRRNRRK